MYGITCGANALHDVMYGITYVANVNVLHDVMLTL